MKVVLILLVCFAPVIIYYDHLNFLMRRLRPYDEDLDTCTNALLDLIDKNGVDSWDNYTLNVKVGDNVERIWISNYPYSYGMFYEGDNTKGISYKTFKRVRKIHLGLLEKQELDKAARIKAIRDETLKRLKGVE